MRTPSAPFLSTAVVALLAACSQPSAQVISGKALMGSFPRAPEKAVVVDATGTVLGESILSADGAFSLAVPAGTGMRIEFVAGDARPALIFPRKGGAIDSRFDVKSAAAPFDLGTVRYVGDPAVQQFSYQTQALTADEQSDGDGECEDGVDADTGAVCVDDDDDENATCEADDGADQDDGEENDEEADGVDCVDGVDAATGAECDGGPTANQDDGEEDDDAETNDDVPGAAAVADHNLPASIGCEDNDENEGEDDNENEDGEENDD